MYSISRYASCATRLGGFRGSKIQLWGGCHKAGPIGTKCGTHLWIHLGMNTGQKQFAPRYPRAIFWVVLWGQQFKRLGNVVKRLGINFAYIMQINLGMDTG